MYFLALGILFIMGTFALYYLANFHRFGRLENTEPGLSGYPSVSIIIPVRNEEEHVEQALSSVLKLDYPYLEIVVLDDRSTDRTPEILSAISKANPALKAFRIGELPKGWLGKNHALKKGADVSQGEYLLFSDADIYFAPDTLQRALTYMKKENTDFLALFPEMIVETAGAKIFAATFLVLFMSFARPWAVANPRNKEGFGIGAFSLVRRDAYLGMGTHAAIALYPDDDLELGRRVKKAGFSCRILDGNPLIKVHWYRTVWANVLGFEKNYFAGLDFKYSHFIFSSIALSGIYLWPWAGMFLPFPGQWAYAIICALQLLVFGFTCRKFRVPVVYGLLYPIGVIFFLLTGLRSVLLTYWQGGIKWRDTFYPLAELKAARKPRRL